MIIYITGFITTLLWGYWEENKDQSGDYTWVWAAAILWPVVVLLAASQGIHELLKKEPVEEKEEKK